MRTYARLQYVPLNRFHKAEELSAADKRMCDAISHESKSYFTKEGVVHVPVATVSVPLPPTTTQKRRRIGAKSADPVSVAQAPSQPQGPLREDTYS